MSAPDAIAFGNISGFKPGVKIKLLLALIFVSFLRLAFFLRPRFGALLVHGLLLLRLLAVCFHLMVHLCSGLVGLLIVMVRELKDVFTADIPLFGLSLQVIIRIVFFI